MEDIKKKVAVLCSSGVVFPIVCFFVWSFVCYEYGYHTGFREGVDEECRRIERSEKNMPENNVFNSLFQSCNYI